MTFQRNSLASAVSRLLGIAAIVAAAGAPAQTPESGAPAPVPDIRIDVTGSNIKRVEGESALPLEIVTREDIRRTGATTISEMLRYIPSIDLFSQPHRPQFRPAGKLAGENDH